MDMHFHWLRDLKAQEQFEFQWKRRVEIYSDYATKHHSPSHHREMCNTFLTPIKKILDLRAQLVTARPPARMC